jgi:hypothetical protein
MDHDYILMLVLGVMLAMAGFQMERDGWFDCKE